MDGARLFNAAVALGVSPAELAEPFDSVCVNIDHTIITSVVTYALFSTKVSICLSKGLGAPVGSLLVGSQPFIKDARRCRKALGGGMRQAGIIAAAGLLSLQKGPSRMVLDHAFTKQLAMVAAEAGSSFMDVDMDSVETNMVMLRIKLETGMTPCMLTERMARSTPEETEKMGKEVRLLAYPMTATNVRLVVHCNMTPEDIELAKVKLDFVLQEFTQEVNKRKE